MKIKYEVNKINNEYRLCIIKETKTGMNIDFIMRGTKKDCEEEKKRLTNEKKNNNC